MFVKLCYAWQAQCVNCLNLDRVDGGNISRQLPDTISHYHHPIPPHNRLFQKHIQYILFTYGLQGGEIFERKILGTQQVVLNCFKTPTWRRASENFDCYPKKDPIKCFYNYFLSLRQGGKDFFRYIRSYSKTTRIIPIWPICGSKIVYNNFLF